MRVVIMEIDSYGYLGYNSCCISEYKVFGNRSLAEDWINKTYINVEQLSNLYSAGQIITNYHCNTKQREIHYIRLIDKEIIEEIES